MHLESDVAYFTMKHFWILNDCVVFVILDMTQSSVILVTFFSKLWRRVEMRTDVIRVFAKWLEDKAKYVNNYFVAIWWHFVRTCNFRTVKAIFSWTICNQDLEFSRSVALNSNIYTFLQNRFIFSSCNLPFVYLLGNFRFWNATKCVLTF